MDPEIHHPELDHAKTPKVFAGRYQSQGAAHAAAPASRPLKQSGSYLSLGTQCSKQASMKMSELKAKLSNDPEYKKQQEMVKEEEKLAKKQFMFESSSSGSEDIMN